MNCSTPGSPVLHHPPELPQTHVHRVSDAIQPSHPLSPPSPLALNLSQHQVFSNELTLCIRWSKYWSFSISTSLSNEYSGPISFRMDWLDLLTVQGTLKSLFQHHSTMPSLCGAGPKAGHQQVCFAHLAHQLERGWMDVAHVALGKPRGPGQQWQCPSARA